MVFNILTRVSGAACMDLFTLVISERTQEKGMKLSQERFMLGTRKRFFTQRVIEYWNKLSREMDRAPSLTKSKKHLDNVSAYGVFCTGPGAGL